MENFQNNVCSTYEHLTFISIKLSVLPLQKPAWTLSLCWSAKFSLIGNRLMWHKFSSSLFTPHQITRQNCLMLRGFMGIFCAPYSFYHIIKIQSGSLIMNPLNMNNRLLWTNSMVPTVYIGFVLGRVRLLWSLLNMNKFFGP